MKKMDHVEIWLKTVSATHSGSENTERLYRRRLRNFLEFVEGSAQEILNDYENMTEKEFKRKYSRMMRFWISELHQKGYTPSSLGSLLTAVRSFFKYNDLPLGFIPIPLQRVVFHNREVERGEILQILGVCRPRERAFYTMMSQTGLRPHTLCLLQKKHLEPDFSNGVVPCCVKVPQELVKGKFRPHFTFMGEESVKALKDYFATRSTMTDESPIFTLYGDREGKFCGRRTFTNIFGLKAEALRKKGLLKFERLKKGRPSEVRLYNLRKFFRKYAGQAGVEYVNFWMGHTASYKAPYIPASDEHYFNKEDIEFQRKIYAEKATPFLRLETATPTETEKEISELRKQLEQKDETIQDMQRRIEELSTLETRIGKLEELLEKYVKKEG